MVSNKKTIKRFKHSGKRQTKRYTDCVKYVQSKGAEVDEPEVEEVFLEKKEKEPEIIEEPEPVPEVEEDESDPVPVEEEEEEETVPSTNDFRFEEPENFKVQTEYLEGDRVVVDDPLSLQNARADEALKVAPNPKPEMEMEMEMEVPVKEKKSTNKPKSKKRGNKKKGKSSKKRKQRMDSEKGRPPTSTFGDFG